MLIELMAEGAVVLAGLLLLGATVGVWLVVYDHCLCKDQAVQFSVAKVFAVRGAAAMPTLAALHLIVGMLVWGLAAGVLFAWFVVMSVRSTARVEYQAWPGERDS